MKNKKKKVKKKRDKKRERDGCGNDNDKELNEMRNIEYDYNNFDLMMLNNDLNNYLKDTNRSENNEDDIFNSILNNIDDNNIYNNSNKEIAILNNKNNVVEENRKNDNTDNLPEDDNNNCDDFLNLLNIGSSNFSNKLNINEHGDVIYDEKKRLGANNLINENNNNNDKLGLLMEKKNEINQNLNKSQIEKYNYAYKKSKLCKWTDEETDKFYQAIEMFGIDLMMVRALIPKFNDKQIRDKYKKEKKSNPLKIEQAIKKNKEINLDAYENEHGKIDHSTHYMYSDYSSTDEKNGTLECILRECIIFFFFHI